MTKQARIKCRLFFKSILCTDYFILSYGMLKCIYYRFKNHTEIHFQYDCIIKDITFFFYGRKVNFPKYRAGSLYHNSFTAIIEPILKVSHHTYSDL